MAYYRLLYNYRNTEEQSRKGSQKALWFMPLPSQVQLVIISKLFLGDIFLTCPYQHSVVLGFHNHLCALLQPHH